MILEVVVSVVIVLTTLIILNLKWSFRFWKNRNVYTPEPIVPFGNVKSVIFGKENIGAVTTKIYNIVKAKGLRYGGFYFFNRPMFVPVDRTLIRHILITDFQHFTDHSGPIDDKREPLAAHLFSLTGAKWKALRTKLTPLFTSGKLKMMFQTLVDCTNDFPCALDSAIKRKEPFDIKDTFARYTTDVIGSVAFGIDCNCLKNPNTEFRVYGRKVFEVGWTESVINAINLICPELMAIFRLKVTKVDVENFFMNMVKETVDHRDKNHYERNDFIQLLMNLRNKEIKVESSLDENGTENHIAYYQNGLTIEEIAAQSFVFFLAGFETSSTTLNFLMYEIVLHLEIQEKLREEVVTVLKAHDGKITYEAIQEMTYMDKCINETLRKYPPLPVTPRRCTKDYKVPDSDLVIEKGRSVLIPIYGIQHDPEYYPDPEKFDPERFSEENKNKRPPVTFIPFGEGPRICIGLRMGLLQAKVGLTALLRDYKFTLNNKTKVPLQFAGRQFISTADGGVWIEAEKVQ
ncbi:probable cytochrome P450 6a14 [Agrilus planipennis]|uniref:Probable cytochrome P450 6a14 n=1 Tax=Agrilus planipennis TaxID=224129 RepID=A0A1W4WLU0_AGRPL|nr:probable cytochrome P450 6a14 [Agrilus planipennis]XP_025835518.1 probable cytochrome P450 6a14 [Agrilus planipennis]